LKGLVIGKTPHRIFELYEIRDEAIEALTPKNAVKFDHDHLDSSNYQQISITALDLILHVQFSSKRYDEATLAELTGDFLELSKVLAMNSKILIDFENVEAFCPRSIDLLAEFNKKLRNKGSSVVLCCLDEEVMKSFFPNR